MRDLIEFLNQKGAEYAPFDPSRAVRIFALFKLDFLPTFSPKVIHIVGTNGKGSTGRMIARGLKNVLHFTSPHLLSLNERFYLDGELVSMQTLEEAHQILIQKPYMQEASYFEYLTFLCLFLARDLDFLVLEAGLGGEFDSTNVIEDKISVFTQIGLDHCEILGESIEEIATTKLNSMGKVAFLGIQNHKEVLPIAKKIAQDRGAELRICSSLLPPPFDMPLFLLQNLTLASQVLDYLGVSYELEHIARLDLCGRAQKYAKNITLDVGHNPDGAKAICKEYENKKITLVYNAYKQKDISQVLEILSPIIKEVQIIEVNDSRIVERERLEGILKSLDLPYREFVGAKRDEEYLVFGSFSVVRAFLERENER